jgi:hypothetical protein
MPASADSLPSFAELSFNQVLSKREMFTSASTTCFFSTHVMMNDWLHVLCCACIYMVLVAVLRLLCITILRWSFYAKVKRFLFSYEHQ